MSLISRRSVGLGLVGLILLTFGFLGYAQTTETTLSSSENPSVFGQSVTFTATVTVTVGTQTPSGTITFYDGAAVLGTGTLTSSAPDYDYLATFAVSTLAVGQHAITAEYPGDTDTDASTSDILYQMVNKANTTLSIDSDSPDSSVAGQPYTVTGQVYVTSPGSGTPTGTVTVNDGDGNTCAANVVSGAWSCNLTSTSVGTKTLTATYEGDENFNGSSDTESHTVNKRATKTTITGSDTPLIVNDTGTFTVTVTDISPGTPSIPTGTVTVTVVPSGQGGMSPSSPLALDAAGQATFTYTPSSALDPTHTFTATYGGDSVHAAALNAVLVQQIIKRAVDVQLICSPVEAFIGQPINCQIVLSDDTTAGSYVTPDETYLTLSDDRWSVLGVPNRFGTVTWATSGGDRIGTFTYTPAAWDTDADQALPFVVPAPAQATATITAEYAGSPVHANEQAEQPLTIRLRPTWTSVMCSMPPILVNQTVVDCTVTVEDISGVSQGATPPEGVITLTTDVAGTSGTSNKSGPTGSPDSEWEFDYVCTRLDEKADFDTIQADYAANDGIHADSSGAFAQGIQRRPTVTTLSCSSTATGVECTATTKEDSGNAGVDVLLEGGFVLLPDDDITGCTSLGPATEPTCTDFPVNEDALLVNVSVQFNPTNDVHLPSTASETVDRSEEFDPDPTPSNASNCDSGCGEGGVDIGTMIYDLNAAAVALHAVQMGLETAALVADVIPDLFTGGGVIVVAGVTIPISDIAAGIISGSSIALEIAIVAMTTDLDGDGIPDAVEDTVTKTDSTLTDTDGDAMGDMDEIGYCAGYYGGSLRPDPNNPDSDSDGLMDGYELAPFATDVCVADTDCDTLPDGVEIACRTDPTAVNGFYRGGYTSSYSTTYADTFAALADVIAIGGAGVFPFADLRDHPNPREGDTDGDGLADDIEFGQGRLAVDTSTPYAQNATSGYYSPYVNDDDSDDDGLHDGAEDLNGNGQWNGTVVGTGANVTSGETHLCLADTDGDGLTDGEEEALFGRGGIEVHSTLGTITVPALDDDSDDDGLSDYEEQVVTGTDPLDWDTDDDGLSDADELIVTGGDFPNRSFYQESDPLDPDTDDDGLSDFTEYDGSGVDETSTDTVNSGDPDTDCPFVNDADSDNDGLQDGYEIGSDGVWLVTRYGNSTQDGIGETSACNEDTDNDGLLDGEEEGLFGQGFVNVIGDGWTSSTVPALDTDCDRDGLSDYEEVHVTMTNPLHWDTDGDSISDANELIATSAGTFPVFSATTNTDGVARTFYQESDPLDPDTDDDLLLDTVEYDGTRLGDSTSPYWLVAGGDPDTDCPYVNDDDSDDDGLQDGIEDADRDGVWDSLTPATSTSQKSTGETNLCDPDTDDDGLTDGEEVGLFGGLPVGTTSPHYLQWVSTTAGNTIPALDDDSDNDGLSDYEEVNVTGTDPLDADTDDDGLLDSRELIVTGGAFPYRSFYQESDPLDPDTDDDGIRDDVEYFNGVGSGVTRASTLASNPGDPDDVCPYVNDDDSDDDGLQDGTEDANHDGTWGVAGSGITVGSFANGGQAVLGVTYWETDLCNPDTDGDGLLDGEEVSLIGGAPIMPGGGFDPQNPLTRPAPGFYTVTPEAVSTWLPVGTSTVPAGYTHTPSPSPGTQGFLIAPYQFSPQDGLNMTVTIPALDQDSDNDGLSDYEEVNITGTDPLDQDSDNDTIMDSDELIAIGGAVYIATPAPGIGPRRTFDQESDPLDINTDDDDLFDSQEYIGSGLSLLAGATGGVRDLPCPFVNDDDSDDDGIQDGAVVTITPTGVITSTGAQYSYTHYEDFIDLNVADEEHPGVMLQVPTSGYGEQQDDAFWDVCDPDSDGDGLNDGEEIAIGTNPNDWDTDDDGRNDWHEVTGGGPIPTDPFDPDTDDDGLLDSAEVFGLNPTNPLNADTDGDGLCDGGTGTPWMGTFDKRIVINPICKSCSNPATDANLVACSTSIRTGSVDGIGDHPNPHGYGEDKNGNGAWDGAIGQLWQSGIAGTPETDPNQYDTDGDADGDGIEVLGFSTSRQGWIPTTDLFGRTINVTYPACGCLEPLIADTDGDGLSDGYEDNNHDGNFDFLPSDFDYEQDPLPGPPQPNPNETNPCDPDTDDDDLTDYEERYQAQVFEFYANWDNDGDGLYNEDPVDGIDNDSDGLVDEDPVEPPFNPTNPLDHDTDNDWLLDGFEVKYICAELACSQLDNDTDALINEDPVDGLDNDGDGLLDEDPVDFIIRFVPMLDPTCRDSDSDGFIDGLDDDPCNSECIPVLLPPEVLPIDTDGDSFSDEDEIFAGTHPNDPEDHPIAFCNVDMDFDQWIDDRVWLEPSLCCGIANSVVIDIDNNVLIDFRLQIVQPRDVRTGDFDGDGAEDDVRYIVEYAFATYRVLQPRIVATIDDYDSDLVINWVVVERK